MWRRETSTSFLLLVASVAISMASLESDSNRMSSLVVRADDIDECVLGTHNCVANATICVNTDASFECEDVDECALGTHDCDEQWGFPNGWSCVNEHGGFKCEDVDECATGTHDCPFHEDCYNFDGAFFCFDRDECADGSHTCDPDTERCENLNGPILPYWCLEKIVYVIICPVENPDCDREEQQEENDPVEATSSVAASTSSEMVTTPTPISSPTITGVLTTSSVDTSSRFLVTSPAETTPPETSAEAAATEEFSSTSSSSTLRAPTTTASPSTTVEQTTTIAESTRTEFSTSLEATTQVMDASSYKMTTSPLMDSSSSSSSSSSSTSAAPTTTASPSTTVEQTTTVAESTRTELSTSLEATTQVTHLSSSPMQTSPPATGVGSTTPAPSEACTTVLEAARGCNLWVRNDLVVGTGYVEGKVCVGGSMTAGAGLSLGSHGGYNPGPRCEQDYGLVVGGSISWESGTIEGRYCLGGSDASGPASPLQSSKCSSNREADPQRCEDLNEFESDYQKLLALTDAFQASPVGFQRSAAVLEQGVILIALDATAPLHVVALDASLFDGWQAWGLRITAQGGSLDDIELVVVNLENVAATGLVISKYFDFPHAFGAKVLFNYAGSATIALGGGGAVYGSLLAPRAALAPTSVGMLSGQLVVASYATSLSASTNFNSMPLERVEVCEEQLAASLSLKSDGQAAVPEQGSGGGGGGVSAGSWAGYVFGVLAGAGAIVGLTLWLRKRDAPHELESEAESRTQALFLGARGVQAARVDDDKLGTDVEAAIVYEKQQRKRSKIAPQTPKSTSGQEEYTEMDDDGAGVASGRKSSAINLPPFSALRRASVTIAQALTPNMRRMSNWSRRSTGAAGSSFRIMPET